MCGPERSVLGSLGTFQFLFTHLKFEADTINGARVIGRKWKVGTC